MATQAAKQPPVYEDVDYCRTLPLPRSSVPLESKVDEMLTRLHRIDQKLSSISQFQERPGVPPKPQARRFSIATTADPPAVRPRSSVEPPSRSPRTMSHPNNPPVGSKTLPRPECDFLIAQLKSVRSFVDDNLDDDMEGKGEIITTLNSLMSALICH